MMGQSHSTFISISESGVRTAERDIFPRKLYSRKLQNSVEILIGSFSQSVVIWQINYCDISFSNSFISHLYHNYIVDSTIAYHDRHAICESETIWTYVIRLHLLNFILIWNAKIWVFDIKSSRNEYPNFSSGKKINYNILQMRWAPFLSIPPSEEICWNWKRKTLT